MPLFFAAADLGGMARDTAQTFGWNWPMFLSQVLSFIIVAFLLRIFAYKPILAILQQRREQIAQAQLNSEKIKQQLAEAEQRYSEILARGNTEAQKMIDDARNSASVVAERKQQEAVAAAEHIVAKAREASAIEHERTMAQLKHELGRLVIDTTAKVTGKVLTPDDQRRLQEEASRSLAS